MNHDWSISGSVLEKMQSVAREVDVSDEQFIWQAVVNAIILCEAETTGANALVRVEPDHDCMDSCGHWIGFCPLCGYGRYGVRAEEIARTGIEPVPRP